MLFKSWTETQTPGYSDWQGNFQTKMETNKDFFLLNECAAPLAQPLWPPVYHSFINPHLETVHWNSKEDLWNQSCVWCFDVVFFHVTCEELWWSGHYDYLVTFSLSFEPSLWKTLHCDRNNKWFKLSALISVHLFNWRLSYSCKYFL